jgi:hypothetical protein
MTETVMGKKGRERIFTFLDRYVEEDWLGGEGLNKREGRPRVDNGGIGLFPSLFVVCFVSGWTEDWMVYCWMVRVNTRENG